MGKQRRYIALFDPQNKEESDIYKLIKAAPAREQLPFARALMLLGYREIKRNKAHTQGGGDDVSAL